MIRISMNKKRFLCLFLFIFAFFCSHAQQGQQIINVDTSKLPFVQNPDFSKDLVFRQFLEDADFNAKIQTDKSLLFTFYKIHVPENMDFIWLSSRLSPVYKDTISTLNSFSSAKQKIEDTTIIASTFNGLFIPEKPQNAWEELLFKKYSGEGKIQSAKIFKIDGKVFYFLKNERFDSTLALFFLDTNMFSPLKEGVLTSSYGYRISPVSGKWKFHSGIDLACPLGSDVYACKSATVKETAFNSIYGNYIVLQHYNGMTSLYAHLSKILVSKAEKVNGGQLIAKSGTTGASTGPHLHFELKENGKSTDPSKVFDF